MDVERSEVRMAAITASMSACDLAITLGNSLPWLMKGADSCINEAARLANKILKINKLNDF